MGSFHVEVGHQVKFSKTVGESDVYLFAGIVGDLAPNHVDAEFMRRSSYGKRIAHGALLVGFMSATSTLAIQHCVADESETAVSVGYDRIRFIKPVFIGDTVTVVYTVDSIDEEKRRSLAKIEVSNQHGDLVAIAEHILQWVENG